MGRGDLPHRPAHGSAPGRLHFFSLETSSTHLTKIGTNCCKLSCKSTCILLLFPIGNIRSNRCGVNLCSFLRWMTNGEPQPTDRGADGRRQKRHSAGWLAFRLKITLLLDLEGSQNRYVSNICSPTAVVVARQPQPVPRSFNKIT